MSYYRVKDILSSVAFGICSNGSYVKLNSFVEEENGYTFRLYDHMSPKDVLCCEAALVSDKNIEYSFCIDGLFGYGYALGIFTTVMSKRCFSVLLFESFEDYLGFEAKMKDITFEELSVAISSANGAFDEDEESPPDRESVSVLRTVTRAAVKNVLRLERFKGALAFEAEDDKANMYLMPVNVSMPAYVRLITELLLCVLTVSEDKCLNISYGSDVRKSAVRIETALEITAATAVDLAEISKIVPQVNNFTEALCYTARMYDAGISVSRAGGNRVAFDLSFIDNEEREVDFKSRDVLSGFNEAFDMTVRYSLLCLLSDAEK